MILIALGANLPGRHGGPDETLLAARDKLRARGLTELGFSSIWKTAPVPVSDQPWYRNAVMAVDTDLVVRELMALLQSIESDFGRVRDANNRNAARVLDLDIIAYHDAVIDEEGLTVPHPRMDERAFVLYPLKEVGQGWVHPLLGVSVDELIAALPMQEIIRSDDVVA